MLRYKITPLIERTAKDLDFPLDLVKAVITHEFQTIQDNITNPQHIGIRLEDFGKFYFKLKFYREM